jgi:hypothetical protein
MPRPVIPEVCKKMRTMEVNITKTTQEEIMAHMDEEFEKFCDEASEIKRKQNDFLDYVLENGYKKFTSWRTKSPKRYEWDEWMGDKVSHYSSMIMKHFDYKFDLKLCLEAFNTDPDFDIECNPLYFEVFNKNSYDIGSSDVFTFMESQRYLEAKTKWETEDAEWIRERDLKRTHDSNHHPVEYHEEQIKLLEEKFGNTRESYLRREGKNGVLVSSEVDNCKYCILAKKWRHDKPIREQQEAEREAKLEQEQEESDRKWKAQKELERKQLLESRFLYKCDLCKFETYDEQAFESHENSKEHKKIEELRKFFCEDCEVQCRNQMEYNIHIQTKKHKIKIGEIEKQIEFICTHCNYVTHLKQNYDKHLLTKGHQEKTK